MSTHRMTARMRAAAALLIVAVSATAAACGSSTADEPADTGTRQVETAKGPVTVPADPQRVVVLNGALAGFLFDLDAKVRAADPRILGVTLEPGEFPPAWAADAEEQGTVAVTSGDDLNLEFIAAQQPDLIIGGGPGWPGQQTIKNYDKLAAVAPTALVPSDLAKWEDQLTTVADFVNRPEKVDGMIAAYNAKVAEVKAGLKLPQGATAVLQSQADGRPILLAPDTPLATLLSSVGFTIDDQIEAKAGNPPKAEAGDWVTFSPELLSTVVDAPVLFVIKLDGGRDIAGLKADPALGILPAFQKDQVYELPASSKRPDYREAMATLDLLAERFKG
ncbi:ABC transporter substrate-binding protein [Nocardia mangyaensis]|uniref:ABC transporter substrate-binding protein n=1 Tax=Nocardia mangyaensis TaxID=2213200 RepID=UPI0026764E25|nr:ABC transporter substrate-binding protein [Nocardia mangyaensis]MDO3647084.1 ABC transporter substrate-binding protein [Nocardia mangyaensis]